MQGAKEALFLITLASHGYPFIGKGVVQAMEPKSATDPAGSSTLDT